MKRSNEAGKQDGRPASPETFSHLFTPRCYPRMMSCAFYYEGENLDVLIFILTDLRPFCCVTETKVGVRVTGVEEFPSSGETPGCCSSGGGVPGCGSLSGAAPGSSSS